MITYISPINMVAEDDHLYFAYKSPLGLQHAFNLLINSREIYLASLAALASIFARWFACSDGQLDKVSYSAACSGWRPGTPIQGQLASSLPLWAKKPCKKKPTEGQKTLIRQSMRISNLGKKLKTFWTVYQTCLRLLKKDDIS